MTDRSGQCKIIIFGPSTLFFSDTAPEDTSLKLTQKALEELRPQVDWDCSGSVLYLSPNMAARVLATVRKERPEVVLLNLPSLQLMQDYVVYRVRERWPGLYRASVSLSQWLLDVGGGGPQGAPWLRGWVFRGPRWLMTKLIGVAPSIRVDEAVQCVRETLDGLLRIEDLHVIYFLPSGAVPPNIPAAEASRRSGAFAQGVSSYCRERRIPWLDQVEARGRAGIVRRLGKDRWHFDLENRQFAARLAAEAIAQAREGATTLQFSFDS